MLFYPKNTFLGPKFGPFGPVCAPIACAVELITQKLDAQNKVQIFYFANAHRYVGVIVAVEKFWCIF